MDRTEEPSIYEGLFLAKDAEVSAFLSSVRGSVRSVSMKLYIMIYNVNIYAIYLSK